VNQEPSSPAFLVDLRVELIAMAAEDQRVRTELLSEDTLFDGYHPRMAEVHHGNAMRLAAIMDEVGWPGRTLVGHHAADAAWLVLQHSIGDPPVMRRGLALLRDAVAMGDVSPVKLAMLEDRVRTHSGLPQLYGTQFDWDERGEMSPRQSKTSPASTSGGERSAWSCWRKSFRKCEWALPARERGRQRIPNGASVRSTHGNARWGGTNSECAAAEALPL
jgi:hypothetical protein